MPGPRKNLTPLDMKMMGLAYNQGGILNFLGKQRDVSTMAHELGHAIHDMYCSKQNLFNYHPILPLAETASVFSEMIVTDLLLKEQTDKTAR